MLCASQAFFWQREWGFMCQAPGQTANNEGLMDSLYPGTAQMISTMLQLLGALLRNADAK